MKRLCSLLLALLLFGGAAAGGARAADRVLGWVLYTDIVAVIDGVPIASYNIAGYTYIVIEDLAQYGFTVDWLPASGRVVVRPAHAADPASYTARYVPAPNTHTPGAPAMPYYETRVTAWLGERRVAGCNIGGRTCIGMDDLADFCAASYVWDAEHGILSLTTRDLGTSDAAPPSGGEPTLPAESAEVGKWIVGEGRVFRDEAVTNGGGASYCLTADTPSYMVLTYLLPAEPETRYIGTCDVRTEGEAVCANLATGTTYSYGTQTVGPSDWHTVRREFETGADGAADLSFLFGYADQPAVGTVWIDNVRVTRAHVWDGGTTLVPPTAAAWGRMEYVCRGCGETRVQALPPMDGARFSTSYDVTNAVTVSVEDARLTLRGCLAREGLAEVMLTVGSRTVREDAARGVPFSLTVPLGDAAEGTEVSFSTRVRGVSHFDVQLSRELTLAADGAAFTFARSPVWENNLAILTQYLDPALGRQLTISPALQALSDEIVGEETNDYRKLYLLHRWVAQNLYYDYDNSLLEDEGLTNDLVYLPDEVYAARRAVCSGYANLLAALIQAQGIPAMPLTTFALGVSGDTFDDPASARANHAHVEAWLADEARWVLMDPTWDSGNRYQAGAFRAGERQILHFDMSWEYFSASNKLFPRQ